MQINVAGSRSSSSARHWAGFLVLRMFRTCVTCAFSQRHSAFSMTVGWCYENSLYTLLVASGRICAHLGAGDASTHAAGGARNAAIFRRQGAARRSTEGRCRDLLSALNLRSQHDNSKSSQDILKISEIRMSDLNQYEHGMQSQENNMVKMLFPNLVYMFLAMT